MNEDIIKVVGIILNWFVSTAFILWGWNVLAWHFNLPQFGYWEMFAMRMALSAIADMFIPRSKKD